MAQSFVASVNSPLTYVAYLRDSGGDAQELSTTQQQHELERWAAANHALITHWYRDEARPGSTTIGRDGFLAMIDHFRHDDAPETGLLIWRWSRFSRDINDAQFYRADLRRRGYRIVSINDNLPEGPEAILFEAALDWSNQRFLDDLSRDVKRGLHNLVLQYGCIPGTPPRGFTRQLVEIGRRRDGKPHIAHRWVPDPDLVPTVQTAFRLRAAGHSLAEINNQTHLYQSLNSYKTFFTNPLYIGRLEFADLVIEDYCPPLIDQPTWTAVQALIKVHAESQHLTGDNPRHPRRIESPYLLSGLLYCNRCGSPLYGTNSAKSDKTPYHKYICARSKRRRDCDAKPIPVAPVDQIVIQTVLKTLANPKYLAAIEEQQRKNQHGRLQQLHTQRDELTGRLANTRRAITQLTTALETAIDDYKPRSIISRLQELDLQETDLIQQIKSIDDQIKASPIQHTPSQLDQIAANLKEILTHDPINQKRRILSGILHRIYIDRDGPTIHGRIIIFKPPGPAPPIETGSISRTPLGAPLYTPIFTATLRKWQKKRP